MTINYFKDGITGFSYYNAVEISLQNSKEFLTYIYDFLNTAKGKLIDEDFDIKSKNFYFVKIRKDETEFYILLNAFKPVIAFAEQLEPFNIKFVDYNMLGNLSINYNILSKKELEGTIGVDFIKELNEVEHIMINKWKPLRLGDLIFNYWD